MVLLPCSPCCGSKPCCCGLAGPVSIRFSISGVRERITPGYYTNNCECLNARSEFIFSWQGEKNHDPCAIQTYNTTVRDQSPSAPMSVGPCLVTNITPATEYTPLGTYYNYPEVSIVTHCSEQYDYSPTSSLITRVGIVDYFLGQWGTLSPAYTHRKNLIFFDFPSHCLGVYQAPATVSAVEPDLGCDFSAAVAELTVSQVNPLP